MEILQQDNEKKGRFYILNGQEEAAQMTYVWAGGDKIIIDHTEVGESLKGKGAGKQMVYKAVEFARKNGLHIVPLCPFAKSVFDKDPTLNDLL